MRGFFSSFQVIRLNKRYFFMNFRSFCENSFIKNRYLFINNGYLKKSNKIFRRLLGKKPNLVAWNLVPWILLQQNK